MFCDSSFFTASRCACVQTIGPGLRAGGGGGLGAGRGFSYPVGSSSIARAARASFSRFSRRT